MLLTSEPAAEPEKLTPEKSNRKSRRRSWRPLTTIVDQCVGVSSRTRLPVKGGAEGTDKRGLGVAHDALWCARGVKSLRGGRT